MLALGLLLFASSCSGVWSLKSNTARHVLDRRESAPAKFVKVAATPADATLELYIQLANSDISGLEEYLKITSDPASPQYGNWLTREQTNVYVAPPPESLKAVNSYLKSHGITAAPATPAGDLLTLNVTVAKANALFGADFHTFKSTDTGASIVRTLSYSVPAALKDHLRFVYPTTSFPTSPKSRVSSFRKLSGPTALATDPTYAYCKEYITPACIQHMYGLPTAPATATANRNDSITVTAYEDQYAQQADLSMFLVALRPDVNANIGYTSMYIGLGPQDPQGNDWAGLEADLDIEYTVGLATDVPVRFVSVADSISNDGTGGFYVTAVVLAVHNDTSHVVTTSYGDDEDEVTPAIAEALCNIYMQLSAQGVTVIFASGDGGVSGGQPQTCTTFVPTFPSGCPYILSVGATQYNGAETAANFSSGGFSTLFPRPWYQESAVSTYLSKLGSTHAGLYNASGRAYPDIAAVGVNAEVAYAGQFGLVDGTSVSAPVVAATIALLNDRLLAAGRPTLGLIQPLIYANPHALTDVKAGNNPGCGTDGFSATSGWDPVTGLGVPDFDSLLKVIGFHK